MADANETMNEDVTKMMVLWRNELNAPDLLHFNDELVSDMLDQIKNQKSFVDIVNDDKSSLTEERSFANKLYQMEIDRLRYLVASYLRTRLQKIERYSQYISHNAEYKERLSAKELHFSQQHDALLRKHLATCFLAKIPEELGSIDEENMQIRPNEDEFVFSQSQEALGQLQCDDRGAEYIELQVQDRHVLRYRCVKNLVESNQIALL